MSPPPGGWETVPNQTQPTQFQIMEGCMHVFRQEGWMRRRGEGKGAGRGEGVGVDVDNVDRGEGRNF